MSHTYMYMKMKTIEELTSVKSPSSLQMCTSQGTFGCVVGYMVGEWVVVESRYGKENETKECQVRI